MPFRANLAKFLEQAATNAYQAQQNNSGTKEQQFPANDFWTQFQQGYNNVLQGRPTFDDGNTTASRTEPQQNGTSYPASLLYPSHSPLTAVQSYASSAATSGDPVFASQIYWRSVSYSDLGVTLDIPATATVASQPPLMSIAMPGNEIFMSTQPVCSKEAAHEYLDRQSRTYTNGGGLTFNLMSPPRLLTGTKPGVQAYLSTHRTLSVDDSWIVAYCVVLTSSDHDHANFITASG